MGFYLRGGYTSNFRFRVLLYLIDRHALISYPNCPKSVLNETSVYCEVFCKIYIFQNCNTFGESPGDKKKKSKSFWKKLGFFKIYKSAKSQYFFKISKTRVRMVRASTKLSNRILIFGPKNFWRASECNSAIFLPGIPRKC